ncbi:MAG: lipocalin family protein [Spirochaetia bacterium]
MTSLNSDVEALLVEKVDVERYSGLWYQVARYPHSFQRGECTESTAEYTIRDDGKIEVLNHCWKDYYGGESSTNVRAIATPVDPSGNRLKVVFFRLFPAQYLIIELDEDDYQWAAVTGPSLDTLWVLSREPSLPGEIYESIIDSLVEKGFNRNKIIKTSRQE